MTLRSPYSVQRLALWSIAAYSAGLLALTFGPLPVDPRLIAELRLEQPASNNWAPLATILPVLAHHPATVATVQIGGNLVLLAPLGFLLPVLSSRCRRLGTTLVVGFVVSLIVETAQLAASTVFGFVHKSFDVDDLLLNTSGVVIGWVAWRLWSHFLVESAPAAGNTGDLREAR